MLAQYEYRPGPTHNRSRSDYAHLADHLRDNPGVWVKVRTAPNPNSAASAAYQIKVGRRAAFRPAGDFDAYSEGCDVVARYIGGGACHGGSLDVGGYCTICGTVNPEVA